MTAQTFFMADIRRKRSSARRAVAVGEFQAGPVAFPIIVERRLPKGDALMLAEIAGIQGAKLASSLMPLCHPLSLELVRVRCLPIAERNVIRVYCEVALHAKTGVEMEALAGVNGALLTLYDLSKPVEAALSLGGIRLLFKEGGKRGLWVHPEGMTNEERAHYRPNTLARLDGVRARVITLSDRAHAGIYADEAGPVAIDALSKLGAEVDSRLLPDGVDTLKAALREAADQQIALVICSGGTGLGPRDFTPEALRMVASRPVSCLGEMFRVESREHTQLAWVSRADAAIVGEQCLVICLPGSPKAVRQGMDILSPVLAHCLAIIRGDTPPPP
jgi:molybdenum cofactor biosynthesis protein MoaC